MIGTLSDTGHIDAVTSDKGNLSGTAIGTGTITGTLPETIDDNNTVGTARAGFAKVRN